MGSCILQAPAHSIKMLVAWNKFLSEAINLPKQGKYGNHYNTKANSCARLYEYANFIFFAQNLKFLFNSKCYNNLNRYIFTA